MPRHTAAQLDAYDNALNIHLRVTHTRDDAELPKAPAYHRLPHALIPATREALDDARRRWPTTDPDMPTLLSTFNSPWDVLGHVAKAPYPIDTLARDHDPAALELARDGKPYHSEHQRRWNARWTASLEAHRNLLTWRYFELGARTDRQMHNLRLLAQVFIAPPSEGLISEVLAQLQPEPGSEHIRIGDTLIPQAALHAALRHYDPQSNTPMVGVACVCGERMELSLDLWRRQSWQMTATGGVYWLEANAYTQATAKALEGLSLPVVGRICNHLNQHLDHQTRTVLEDQRQRWLKRMYPVMERFCTGWDFAHEQHVFCNNLGTVEFAFRSGAWLVPEMDVNRSTQKLDSKGRARRVGRMELLPALAAFGQLDVGRLAVLRERLTAQYGQRCVFPPLAMSVWVDAEAMTPSEFYQWLRENPDVFFEGWRAQMAGRAELFRTSPNYASIWHPITWPGMQEIMTRKSSVNLLEITSNRYPKTFNNLRARISYTKTRAPTAPITLTRSLRELLEPYVRLGIDLDEVMHSPDGREVPRFSFKFVEWKTQGMGVDNAMLRDKKDGLTITPDGKSQPYRVKWGKDNDKGAAAPALGYEGVFAALEALHEAGFELPVWDMS